MTIQKFVGCFLSSHQRYVELEFLDLKREPNDKFDSKIREFADPDVSVERASKFCIDWLYGIP